MDSEKPVKTSEFDQALKKAKDWTPEKQRKFEELKSKNRPKK